MQQTAEIELYDILKTRFSESEAKDIVANIGHHVHDRFEERKSDFATKEDIAKLKGELKEDLAKLDGKLEARIAETKTVIAENKAEMIKWMFIFWIGQVAATVAIVKLLIH